MADTITYGLVVQTVRSGHESTNVLKSVSGKYEDRYECDSCSGSWTKEKLYVGTSWVCEDCDEYREISGPVSDHPYPPECCGNDMTRRDGKDGTLEGYLCPDCSESNGARIYDDPTSFFVCDECGTTLHCVAPFEPDEDGEHLYEHLNYAWE